MSLSDAFIKAAKPKQRAYRLFDGGGLYLEIAPNGGKWWRLKYRFARKEKRLSLGVYPETGLKDAREKRDANRSLLRNGIDPSASRKAQHAAQADAGANSFEVIAREWYAKFSPGWATSHGEKIIRRLERDVFPWIGKLPVANVSAPELLTVLRRIDRSNGFQAHSAAPAFRWGELLECYTKSEHATRCLSSLLGAC